MTALLDGDYGRRDRGPRPRYRLLNTLPQQGPATYRGLWPLLLACRRRRAGLGRDRRGTPPRRRPSTGSTAACSATPAPFWPGGAANRNWPPMRPGPLTPISSTTRSGATWRGCTRPEPALADGGGEPRHVASGRPSLIRCPRHRCAGRALRRLLGRATRQADGPCSASPPASPTCLCSSPRASPTKRSRPGFMFRHERLRSTSRACCARPAPGPELSSWRSPDLSVPAVSLHHGPHDPRLSSACPGAADAVKPRRSPLAGKLRDLPDAAGPGPRARCLLQHQFEEADHGFSRRARQVVGSRGAGLGGAQRAMLHAVL